MTPKASGTTGISKFVPRYVQRRVQHSLVYLILFIAFMAFVMGLYKGGLHLAQLKPEDITLRELPSALMLSWLRMLISYSASLVCCFIFGLLAARSALGERIIIPVLNILQSVPVVGFFPAAISFFISVSHGHRLGIELAAIFLIFTGQAWNMSFSVYESTKTIPTDNIDAAASFGVRGSLRFWKLYAPAAVPRLVYNSILSWSNGWFFLVACEIIAIGQIKYNLPGIGSFLARAAEQEKVHLVFWGLMALASMVLAMDFLVWRPLSIWAERFRQDYSSSGEHPVTSLVNIPFLNNLFAKLSPLQSRLLTMLRILFVPVTWILKEILLPLLWDLPAAIGAGIYREVYLRFAVTAHERWNRLMKKAGWLNFTLLWTVGAGIGLIAGYRLVTWMKPPWPPMAREIPLALLVSTARLIASLFLSLLWTLPLVLWSWNKPRVRQTLTTIAQLGASLPATALFPLIVLVTVKKFGGGMEAASLILLVISMQWYLLFNGLGGAAIIPNELAEVSRSLGLSRIMTWKRLVLPAIRPALITGGLTAWGGGWNALVISEYVTYKDHVMTAKGIGALLNRAAYQLGDHRAIMFCVAGMVGWILIINSVVWRPLYQSAAERYKFQG